MTTDQFEKIDDGTWQATTFAAFANRHGLTLELHERVVKPGDLLRGEHARFYARFTSAEVKVGHCLRGEFGNGPTKEAAIQAYADCLRGETLIIRADHPDRREIQCPNEWLSEPVTESVR